ncbi:hypothetical protein [Streptomyces viridochromogenes]|uniref:hypothetical protein n=1 Tax=Streptomyces viridochromogenes TaxID=1938 RepID=UPI00069F3BD5|nr:hypothetical protein [Streptomyces viridochromogenes]KOG09001.1 hypothetical protein ADK36_41835 [Streptomyces viridochromogenes]KOG12323.1 hypothetical protein ADK35_34515 [Streptomyces viridochromogenes]
MNDDERRQGEQGDQGERDFEVRLRELLAEDAYTFRPPPAPYPAIRRRGVLERRRRVAAAGAMLAALAAMPVGAYALGGGRSGAETAMTPVPSVSAPRTPSPTPGGPARPATPGQLLDGITFAQAADGLEKCLAFRGTVPQSDGRTDLDTTDGYRIILALRSTGDSNATGDGMFVVAAERKEPKEAALICRIVDGEAVGLSGAGAAAPSDPSPVFADLNGGKLYQQSVLDRGNWKLPFRWGLVGTVKASVAKVTVSYGDSSAEAALDHGWFVASGVLNQQVTLAPRIKGYDADGRLVYDSDEDRYYARTLP